MNLLQSSIFNAREQHKYNEKEIEEHYEKINLSYKIVNLEKKLIGKLRNLMEDNNIYKVKGFRKTIPQIIFIILYIQ